MNNLENTIFHNIFHFPYIPSPFFDKRLGFKTAYLRHLVFNASSLGEPLTLACNRRKILRKYESALTLYHNKLIVLQNIYEDLQPERNTEKI